MTLQWTKPAGGKRYNASAGGHLYELVRQNTAAGGPRWKAYDRPVAGGLGRVVYKGPDFKAAKAAVEAIAESAS